MNSKGSPHDDSLRLINPVESKQWGKCKRAKIQVDSVPIFKFSGDYRRQPIEVRKADSLRHLQTGNSWESEPQNII
jgi:hypothetical protein